jgi:hypothetical protein
VGLGASRFDPSRSDRIFRTSRIHYLAHELRVRNAGLITMTGQAFVSGRFRERMFRRLEANCDAMAELIFAMKMQARAGLVQAIEAQRATTTKNGVVEDESAVAKPCTQHPEEWR